jgi:hypothetical protein
MGTDCAPILADLFLDANFFRGLLNNKDGKWTQTFDSSFCYIDDVLSLNNSWLGECLHRIPLYQIELGVEDTTGFQKSASYIELQIEIDNRGRLKTHIYHVLTSLSQKSTSHSLVAIFHQHQHIEFTFHNLYVILGLIPSTVIFCTGLSWWHKSYLERLRCSYVEVILWSSLQTDWPLRNINFSICNGSLPILQILYFSLITDKTLIGPDYE